MEKEQQKMKGLGNITEHEFEQTLGHNEGEGSLVCCSTWGGKESDIATE